MAPRSFFAPCRSASHIGRHSTIGTFVCKTSLYTLDSFGLLMERHGLLARDCRHALWQSLIVCGCEIMLLSHRAVGSATRGYEQGSVFDSLSRFSRLFFEAQTAAVLNIIGAAATGSVSFRQMCVLVCT